MSSRTLAVLASTSIAAAIALAKTIIAPAIAQAVDICPKMTSLLH